MADLEDRYFVYENRLASFKGPQPVTKKRASNASSRAPKTLQWPHKSLSPADLAGAGFFFEPMPGSPDNVVCFLCEKSLDGWEEDDNPLDEHLKHSPACGWAIMAAIEAEVGEYGKLHPLDPRMLDARKATFAGRWPYESKKGFKCKTKQLVEAGWKYTPTLDSDDMATCAYCQLALDGWESGDKPIDEHYKRSPDCPFFALMNEQPPPKKGGRGKAARSSKASRFSMQSVATAASDLTSVGDLTAEHDDSVLTTTSVMSKKSTRGRKGPAVKSKKTRTKKDEAIEILEDEPQDVEIPAPVPPKPTRGRKRASDAMEESIVTNAEAPAPKKRATARKASRAVEVPATTPVSQDLEMDEAVAAKPTDRKASKASQASLRSQASTASLRAQAPHDDELDHQLQADLERPLTDDENIAADSDSERKAAPAPARGRPRKTTTRKASAQKQKEEADGYAMFDPAPAEPNEAVVEAELKALEDEAKLEREEAETLNVPKKGRKAGTRKASKQTKKAKEPEAVDEPMPDSVPVPETIEEAVPASEPVQEVEALPVPVEDADASTETVVNNPAGRPAAGKQVPGRPAKKRSSHTVPEEPAQTDNRRRSTVPVQIEVEIESASIRESFSAWKRSPKVVRHQNAVAPATAASAAPFSAAAQTPARVEKALPPPPQSATSRPPATPRPHATPSAKQAALSPSRSPQSSDAENQPPSSRPATSARPKRVALAPVAATPMRGSPSKRNVVAGLQSATPWAAVDLDLVFSPGLAGQENGVDRLLRKGGELTSPEKGMTVEEWVYHNAGVAEQKLKHECEAMVTAFEREGTRAMGVLEELMVD